MQDFPQLGADAPRSWQDGVVAKRVSPREAKTDVIFRSLSQVQESGKTPGKKWVVVEYDSKEHTYVFVTQKLLKTLVTDTDIAALERSSDEQKIQKLERMVLAKEIRDAVENKKSDDLTRLLDEALESGYQPIELLQKEYGLAHSTQFNFEAFKEKSPWLADFLLKREIKEALQADQAEFHACLKKYAAIEQFSKHVQDVLKDVDAAPEFYQDFFIFQVADALKNQNLEACMLACQKAQIFLPDVLEVYEKVVSFIDEDAQIGAQKMLTYALIENSISNNNFEQMPELVSLAFDLGVDLTELCNKDEEVLLACAEIFVEKMTMLLKEEKESELLQHFEKPMSFSRECLEAAFSRCQKESNFAEIEKIFYRTEKNILKNALVQGDYQAVKDMYAAYASRSIFKDPNILLAELRDDEALKGNMLFEVLTLVERQVGQTEIKEQALNLFQMLFLSVFALSIIQEGGQKGGQESMYLPKRDTKQPRALLLGDHSFTILSKDAALLKAKGGMKLVRGAIEIDQVGRNALEPKPTATSVVSAVNLPGEQLTQRELNFEKKYGQLRVFTEYSAKKTGETRTVYTMPQYDGDFTYFLQSGNRLSPSQVVSLLSSDVSKTLFDMHENGDVHRDIKLQNILFKINPDGTMSTRLSDFGLATEVAKEGIYARESYGTPNYASIDCLEKATQAKSHEEDQVFLEEQVGTPVAKVVAAVSGQSPQYGSVQEPEKKLVLKDTALEEVAAKAKADDMFATGCVLYELLEAQKIPWGTAMRSSWVSPDNEIRTDVDAQKAQEALDLYQKTVDELTKKRDSLSQEPDKSLYTICLNLLDKDPKKRMPIGEFRLRMQTLKSQVPAP